MFKIFVDSDSDFTPAHCQKYGLGMIPMPYFWEGKSIRPYIDFGDEFDYHAFYDVLRSGVVPATSAVNVIESVVIKFITKIDIWTNAFSFPKVWHWNHA